MAEMSVQMTLTLVDTASPGIRAFMALIDQLGPKVTGLSGRLETLESRLNRVGTASDRAATGLGKVGTAANNADGAVSRFGTNLGALNAIVGAFDAAARAAAMVLNNLVTHLNTAGAAADAFGVNMSNATAGMGAANQQMGQMNNRVLSLTHSLRGLAEVWLASKLFKGGEGAVSEAAEFQSIEARVKALNLPANETQDIIARSRQMSEQMRFISVNQATEARLAAIAGLGRNDPGIIERTLPRAIQVATILKQRGDQSDLKDLIRNQYGVAEARGQTSDPDAMLRTFDLIQKNNAATGGKLTTKDVESVFRQLKYGEGLMISDEGMINVLAFANQLKASGHGGGGSGGQGVTQAGTAATQVLKWAEGGLKNKESIRLMTAMGLIDPQKVREDSDTTQVNVGAGALKDADMAIRDPIGWLMKMAPIMLAFTQQNPKLFYGDKDPRDERAKDEALTKLIVMLTSGQGGTNVGQLMATGVLAAPRSRIQEEAKLTFGSKGTDDALADLRGNWKLSVQEFDAAWDNLKLTIGDKLLPVLTPLLAALTDIITALTEFARDNPGTAQMIALGLAVGTVYLALSGLNRLFGIFTALNAYLAGTGGAAAATTSVLGRFGAAFTAAGSWVTGFVAVLGVLITTIVAVGTAFVVGWDIGAWISSWNVKGSTVKEWFEQFFNWLEARARNGWIRIQETLDLITKTERDKRLLDSREREDAFGHPVDAPRGKMDFDTSGRVPNSATSFQGPGKPSDDPLTRLQQEIDRAKGIGSISTDRIIGGTVRPIKQAGMFVQKGMRNADGSVSWDDDVGSMSKLPSEDQIAIRKLIEDEKAGRQATYAGSTETPEDRERRLAQAGADAVGQLGEYDPNAKAPKREYNELATQAAQEYRRAEKELENHLKTLDALYKSGKLGVEEYYKERVLAVIAGIDKEIGKLQEEKDAYENPANKSTKPNKEAAERIQANIDIKKDDRERILTQFGADEDVGQTNLGNKRLDVERQLEAITGRRHRAEILRLEEVTQKNRAFFVANNDPEHAAMVDEAARRGKASVQFDEIYAPLNTQLDIYKRKEQEVTDEVKAGTKTQVDAEHEVWVLRKQSGEQIQNVLDKLRELATASGDQRLVKLVADLGAQAKTAVESLSPEMLKLKGIFEGAFEGLFTNLRAGTKSFKSIVLDFFGTIEKGISSLAAKAVAEQIGKKLFSGLGDGGDGFLGFLGKVVGGSGGTSAFGALGKLLGFGGSSSSASSSGSGAISLPFSAPSDPIGIPLDIPQFASGIDNVPHDMLALIHKNERVMDAPDNAAYTMAMKTGNTGGDMHLTMNFAISEPTSTKTQNQIAARAAQSLTAARRNT